MKILLVDRLEASLLDVLLADNVFYRPDLPLKSPEIFTDALVSNDIDAVVSRAALPEQVIEAWSSAKSGPTYQVSVSIHGGAFPKRVGTDEPGVLDGTRMLVVEGDSEASAYVCALETLERISTEREYRRTYDALMQASPDNRVLIVGAGVVNLVTAQALQEKGYAVHIVDAGPDPRERAEWTAYGCSHGGDDARMFTLSEMDNYNDREISSAMNNIFVRDVSDLGWAVQNTKLLSKSEQNWIREFEQVPVWLAKRYNEDIFVFNRESDPLWRRWIEEDADLFAGSLLREGILRLYSDPAQHEKAVARQNFIGATKRVLSPEDIATFHPALAGAVRGGHLAGGVEVVGFTVNIHKFVAGLLDRLASGGAVFEWNVQAQALEFDGLGRVTGIRFPDGTREAGNYVISPGAYGDALLAGTRSHGRIHGVLGAWLRLPNVEPELRHSLKLARKGHITEDANVTVATDATGQPIMIIGSGYGHTGVDPRNIDEHLLTSIYMGLVDTAEKYFPEAYEVAREAGSMEGSLKYCVRPWTSTGLGIFETIPAAGQGKCVITGGHNTGGFTQAPAVAQAVSAALGGSRHAMHSAYQPDRATIFFGRPRAEPEHRPVEQAVAV